MNFFKKHLLKFVAITLFSFCVITVAEDFHHHEGMEGQDDCAFCSFLLTASNGTITPVVHPMVPILLVFTLFVLQFSFTSFSSVSPRGRSPPLYLL